MTDRPTQYDPYALLTREEVAKHLRCTTAYVTELTKSGELHSTKVGKRVLVPRAYLEAFIRGERGLRDDDGNWPSTPSLFAFGFREQTDADPSGNARKRR